MEICAFKGWEHLARVLLASLILYLAMINLLRLAGKRTFALLDEFEVCVTLAAGSMVAASLLFTTVPLLQGILALAGMVVVHSITTFAMSGSKIVRDVRDSEPQLLFYRGDTLTSSLRRARVLEKDVREAIRQQRLAAEDVEAVLLDTGGQFRVIRKVRGHAARASG